MSSDQNRGQFVWHELMTTDAAGAGAFYPRVAGWKTQPFELDSTYTVWVGEAGPMGGVMSLPQEAPASSHWMPYIGTPDIALTVATARDLGATLCKDVTQIPNGGSYAVLKDPQGVMFAVFGSSPEPQGSWQPPEDFSWHELSTTDIDAALSFYSELFGWEAAEKHDMGEMGFYQLFARNGTNIGGIFVAPPGLSSHWLSYVRVADVDKATDAAKAAGGRVINGPMEVPGGDWIAQILDPQGAAFAVHEVKSKAQQPKKAAKAPAAPKKVAAKAAVPEPVASKPAKAPSKQAKPAKVTRAVPAAKRGKPARRVAPRKAVARKKVAAQAKISRKRATVAAKGKRTAKLKRTTKLKRTAAKKASAARGRPAARKKVAKKAATRRVSKARRRR